VQAIARLHETLYASSNLAELNFGDYLRDLTNELQHLQSRAEIAVQVFTDDIVLSMNTAIPLDSSLELVKRKEHRHGASYREAP